MRSTQALTIPANARATVKTGVSIALPDGYVGLVHPRSGLSAKHGIGKAAAKKKPAKKAEKKKDAPKDPDPPYKPDKIDGTF